MAKPKGKKIAGWGDMDLRVEVLAEKDVNQKDNVARALGNTWSSGHIVRQLGLARRPIPGGFVYYAYTHSQVSNGTVADSWGPPAFIGMTREDLEWLIAVGMRELFGGDA